MPHRLSPLMADRAGHQRLIDELCAMLQQADMLFDACAAGPLAFEADCGPHLRHVIEHVQAFIASLHSGELDYDARPRDARLERDATLAQAQFQRCARDLRQLALQAWPETLQLHCDSGLDDAARLHCSTTPARELLFLVSHTVHHYAVLAVHLRAAGLALPADFGKAPATILNERRRRIAAAA